MKHYFFLEQCYILLDNSNEVSARRFVWLQIFFESKQKVTLGAFIKAWLKGQS